jgi:hypothetical protein
MGILKTSIIFDFHLGFDFHSISTSLLGRRVSPSQIQNATMVLYVSFDAGTSRIGEAEPSGFTYELLSWWRSSGVSSMASGFLTAPEVWFWTRPVGGPSSKSCGACVGMVSFRTQGRFQQYRAE